jgi:hypothetical protein
VCDRDLLSGSLTVRADPGSGLFSGDPVLDQSTISRKVLGASLDSATVQITAQSPVIGCGWMTPLVNVLVAGPGNAAVIDLIPRPS